MLAVTGLLYTLGAFYLFAYILPIGGGVGVSMLAVGVARRWWAGFLSLPVAILAMRVLPLLDMSEEPLAVALMLAVNLACLLLQQDPTDGLLTESARKRTFQSAWLILGTTGVLAVGWFLSAFLFWTEVGRAGQ